MVSMVHLGQQQFENTNVRVNKRPVLRWEIEQAMIWTNFIDKHIVYKPI